MNNNSEADLATKITISFDFELGWGYCGENGWQNRELAGVYDNLREIFPVLLKSLRDANIRTTWGLVGGMLFDDPTDIPLAHLPKAYQRDVRSFVERSQASTHCGIDLCQELKKYRDVIEIGSHTLTHCYAQFPGMTAEAYVKDVELGINVVEEFFDCEISSHIFTRDQSDFHTSLAHFKPLNMRVNPSFYRRKNLLGRKIGAIKSWFDKPLESRFEIGAIGEVYESGSLYLNWVGGKHEYLKKFLLRRQISRILTSVGSGEHYHLWIHPFNLSENSDVFRDFINLIETLGDMQKKGNVISVPMGDYKRAYKVED